MIGTRRSPCSTRTCRIRTSHPGFEQHPWRMVLVALGTIVVLAAALIAVCCELAMAFTGHAY